MQLLKILHLVEDLHRFVKLYIPQERGQVLEEINQQLCIHRPSLEDKQYVNETATLAAVCT